MDPILILFWVLAAAVFAVGAYVVAAWAAAFIGWLAVILIVVILLLLAAICFLIHGMSKFFTRR